MHNKKYSSYVNTPLTIGIFQLYKMEQFNAIQHLLVYMAKGNPVRSKVAAMLAKANVL